MLSIRFLVGAAVGAAVGYGICRLMDGRAMGLSPYDVLRPDSLMVPVPDVLMNTGDASLLAKWLAKNVTSSALKPAVAYQGTAFAPTTYKPPTLGHLRSRNKADDND